MRRLLICNHLYPFSIAAVTNYIANIGTYSFAGPKSDAGLTRLKVLEGLYSFLEAGQISPCSYRLLVEFTSLWL